MLLPRLRCAKNRLGSTPSRPMPNSRRAAPRPPVSPLPIELISFTGERQDDGNLLRWSTATETDNNYFELERSGDALHFTGIAQVAGHGNSTSMLRYEHLDAAPLKGMNYYRLKQVDNNGDFTYSDVIAIDNSGTAAALSVYPNPTTDLVHINASNVQELTIYDMLGNSVYSGKAGPGGVTDFAPLTNGVYIISAVAGDGTVIRKRFIKN